MGSAFKNPKVVSWWAFLFLFYSLFQPCFAANIITQGQLIRDGETIISAGQKFVLGFFSPGNSTYRYVGIWYYGISQSVVWVANRENKISDESGVISLEENGHLVVLDGNRNPVWSSNSTTSSKNVTATLSDTGNLMILSNNSNNPLWQSFDNSTDTFLPNMRVHVTLQAGENRVISSWKSENDPSFGRYLMGVDPRVSPQLVTWDGQNRLWRSGHWDGLIFIGMPYMRTLYLYGFKISNEENGSYYITYTTFNATDLMKFRIGWNGFAKQEEWDEGENKWNIMQIEPRSDCDIYNKCGNFGICNVVEEESYICNCIEGFDPKNLSQWEKGNRTDGCVRRTNLQCGTNETGVGGKDGFLKMEGVKLPDLADMGAAKNEEDCKEECSMNCSCQAYVFVRGINCMVWNGDLVDMRHFTEGGNELYVRVANSELGGKNKISKVVIIVSAVLGILFLTVSILLLWRFRKKRGSLWKRIEVATVDARRSREFSTDFSGENELGVEGKTGQELALYSFSDIAAATDNFSEENKLGKGGFGPVYKGKLSGEEIAVKRLSKKSGQGLEEFKNEVMLIAKLQHINLVRLLGCCMEGDERILLYEYMLNKSLDCFLFDPAKQAQLDWKRRFTIVEGIARGLVYLHRDSRLRIIHRDLKASNILLDEEMNPKISDFGMAIIFGRNESEASTSRVVGTYGYMAPEYAMEGLFSVKSDVYSFGILLLEIVTGKRNVSFRTPEYSNIVGHAWDLWAGGKAMELVDPSIADFCSQNQVLRCIHVAMLCVQDLAEHRPDISSVVLMLESENATLPMPREPTFTSMRNSGNVEISKDSHEAAFSNDVTITVIIGR